MRKGELQTVMIASLATAILVGAAFGISLEALLEESAIPLLDQTETTLEDIGTGGATTIGAGLGEFGESEVGSQTAEKQMEGLIAYNMMSASNCNAMSTLHAMSIVVDEEGVLDANEDIGSFDLEEDVAEPGELTDEQIQEIFDEIDMDDPELRPHWDGYMDDTYMLYGGQIEAIIESLKIYDEENEDEDLEVELIEDSLKQDKDFDEMVGTMEGTGLVDTATDDDPVFTSLTRAEGAENVLSLDYRNFDHQSINPWKVTGDTDPDEDNELEMDHRYGENVLMMEEVNVSQGEHGYIGRFESFAPLLATGFDRECVGSPSVLNQVDNRISEISDEVTDEISEALDDAVPSPLRSGGVASVTGGAVVLGACVATGGGACVAAGGAAAAASGVGGASASYLISSGGIDIPTHSGIQQQAGFDMEGRQGRMNFDINESFTMGESVSELNDEQGTRKVLNRPLLAMSLDMGERYGMAPGFWKGARYSYMLPDGLEPPLGEYGFGEDEYDGHKRAVRIHPAEYVEENSFWDGHNEEEDEYGIQGVYNLDDSYVAENWLYAFRPRMVNVPIISAEELSDSRLRTNEFDVRRHHVNQLRNFLASTEFVFCEGASGHVQSNSGHLNEDMETSFDRAEISGQVYPRVEIWEGATSCIPQTTDAGILEQVDDLDLGCDSHDDILHGDSVEMFERATADGGEHTVYASCGGERDTTSIGDYAESLEYYIVDESLERCEPEHYRLGSSINLDSSQTWDHIESGDQVIPDRSTNSERIDYEALEIWYDNSAELNGFSIELGKTVQTDQQFLDQTYVDNPHDESTFSYDLTVVETDSNDFTVVERMNGETMEEHEIDVVNQDVDGNNTVDIDFNEDGFVREIEFNRDNAVDMSGTPSYDTLGLDSGVNTDGASLDMDMARSDVETVEITPMEASEIEDILEDGDSFSGETADSMTVRNIEAEGTPEICKVPEGSEDDGLDLPDGSSGETIIQ